MSRSSDSNKGLKAGPGKSTADYLAEARATKTRYGDKSSDSDAHQTKGSKKK